MVDATTVVGLHPIDGGEDIANPRGQEEFSGAELAALGRRDFERGPALRYFAGRYATGGFDIGINDFDAIRGDFRPAESA